MELQPNLIWLNEKTPKIREILNFQTILFVINKEFPFIYYLNPKIKKKNLFRIFSNFTKIYPSLTITKYIKD